MVDMLGQHYAESQESGDVILCVTGDHTTPVTYGDHTYEPVPIAFGSVRQIYADLQAQKAATVKFDEISSGQAAATLGRFQGIELVPLLKRYKETLINGP